MRQLSGMDASFIYSRHRSPGHVCSLIIYDQSTAPGGKVTFKGILDHVRQRLHVVAGTFRQQAGAGAVRPRPPVLDRGPRLRPRVPRPPHRPARSPATGASSASRWPGCTPGPSTSTRPLWEMYVIEGLDNVEGVPPGSFAIMQKIHHAAIDGVTLLEIISAMHDREPDAEPPSAADELEARAVPRPGSCWPGPTSTTWHGPMRFARVMAGRPARRRRRAGADRRGSCRSRRCPGAPHPLQRHCLGPPGDGGAPLRPRRGAADQVGGAGATVNDAVHHHRGRGAAAYLIERASCRRSRCG